ncbi:MAG: phospholipase D family protein [Gammaproteobacteria bacterium]
MKLTFLTDAQAMQALVRLTKECDKLEFAVAWATENDLADTVLKYSKKITRLVIGTHLYQTDPKVLRRFMNVKMARVLPPNGRLFHPKVYLFLKGPSMSAVVGSHNLTRGAFGGANIEASVLIEGSASDGIFVELRRFVAKGCSKAEAIDENTFLFAYEKQYETNRAKREALTKFHRLKKPLNTSSKPSPLDLTWNDFVTDVQKDKYHSFDRRLVILKRARKIFDTKHSFSRMDPLERKAIAGTFTDKEPKLDKLEWGWFGSMSGHGDFKNLVNKPSVLLSRALDHIPSSEEVTEDQYKNFVKDFNAAFKGKTHKGGIPTASRLLAMKRPDQFVAVNKGNCRGICHAFGVHHTTLGLKNYWECIVVPTLSSQWWQRARPRDDLQGLIWDNRAALLDSIYYAE